MNYKPISILVCMISVILILAVMPSCVVVKAHEPHKHSISDTIAFKVTELYLSNKFKEIEKYSNIKNNLSKAYINSLLASSKSKFELANTFARNCIDEEFNTSISENYVTVLFCYTALARNYAYLANLKEMYNFDYKTSDFVKKNMKTLSQYVEFNILLDNANSAEIAKKYYNEMRPIRYEVDPSWSYAPLDRGHIDGNINGIKCSFLLDTGATGISIGRRLAKESKLLTRMKQLHISTKINGYNGSVPAELYQAPSITIGPLHITNAIVTVIDYNLVPNAKNRYKSPSVGINVLSHLGRFAYTKTSIVHNIDYHQFKCHPLHIYFPGVNGSQMDWSILIPLKTSFGQGLYYFDTGLYGGYPETALYLFKSYYIDLKKGGHISKIKIIHDENSSTGVASHTEFNKGLFVYFGFKGNDKDTWLARVLPNHFFKNDVIKYGKFGIIGRNGINRANISVYMDFTYSTLCIGHNVDRESLR